MPKTFAQGFRKICIAFQGMPDHLNATSTWKIDTIELLAKHVTRLEKDVAQLKKRLSL